MRAVKADRYRQAEGRKLLLENAVQGGSQFKPELASYQVHHIAGQGTAGRWRKRPAISER